MDREKLFEMLIDDSQLEDILDDLGIDEAEYLQIKSSVEAGGDLIVEIWRQPLG